MKYKRKLIILIIAIVLYLFFTIIYNRIIVKSEQVDVYILKEDVKKGDIIDISKIKKITSINSTEIEYISDINYLNEKVASCDLYKNQIITKNMFVEKDKILMAQKDKELISLKVSTSENVVSYEIKKNNLVNIYYTGKLENAEQIVKDMDFANVISSGTPEYITLKIMESVKILGVYDTLGNELSDINSSSEERTIDTIVFEVDTKMAMVINNLQKYGEFSLSLIN